MQLQRCCVVHVSIVKLMPKSKPEEIISRLKKNVQICEIDVLAVFEEYYIFIFIGSKSNSESENLKDSFDLHRICEMVLATLSWPVLTAKIKDERGTSIH